MQQQVLTPACAANIKNGTLPIDWWQRGRCALPALQINEEELSPLIRDEPMETCSVAKYYLLEDPTAIVDEYRIESRGESGVIAQRKGEAQDYVFLRSYCQVGGLLRNLDPGYRLDTAAARSILEEEWRMQTEPTTADVLVTCQLILVHKRDIIYKLTHLDGPYRSTRDVLRSFSEGIYDSETGKVVEDRATTFWEEIIRIMEMCAARFAPLQWRPRNVEVVVNYNGMKIIPNGLDSAEGPFAELQAWLMRFLADAGVVARERYTEANRGQAVPDGEFLLADLDAAKLFNSTCVSLLWNMNTAASYRTQSGIIKTAFARLRAQARAAEANAKTGAAPPSYPESTSRKRPVDPSEDVAEPPAFSEPPAYSSGAQERRRLLHRPQKTPGAGFVIVDDITGMGESDLPDQETDERIASVATLLTRYRKHGCTYFVLHVDGAAAIRTFAAHTSGGVLFVQGLEGPDRECVGLRRLLTHIKKGGYLVLRVSCGVPGDRGWREWLPMGLDNGQLQCALAARQCIGGEGALPTDRKQGWVDLHIAADADSSRNLADFALAPGKTLDDMVFTLLRNPAVRVVLRLPMPPRGAPAAKRTITILSAATDDAHGDVPGIIVLLEALKMMNTRTPEGAAAVVDVDKITSRGAQLAAALRCTYANGTLILEPQVALGQKR